MADSTPEVAKDLNPGAGGEDSVQRELAELRAAMERERTYRVMMEQRNSDLEAQLALSAQRARVQQPRSLSESTALEPAPINLKVVSIGDSSVVLIC